MNDDALRDAETYSHPELTRSALELLKVIATHVLEGQTATPLLRLDDLAHEAHQHERTARTNRDALEAVGKIKVHGGGRGVKVARYEILNIDGERPAEPVPLPLRADLREAPRRTTAPDQTSDLFADVPERSDLLADVAPKRSDLFADVVKNVGSFFRRWVAAFLTSDLTWQKVGSFCRRLLPLDVDDARARDVHTFKNVHTHTAVENAKPPPPVHPWHAWCHFLVHVPKFLNEEFVRTHPRQPGETDADVEATMLAFYARTTLAKKSGENEVDFWRRAYADEYADTPTRAAPPHPHVSIPANLYTPGERRRQGSR